MPSGHAGRLVCIVRCEICLDAGCRGATIFAAVEPGFCSVKTLSYSRLLSSALLLGLLVVPFVFLSIQLAQPAQKWMGKVPEETLSPAVAEPSKPLPEREKGFSLSRLCKGDED